MASFTQFVSRLFGTEEAIADTERLAHFMDSRSAFLAQKCVVEFCRVRSWVHWEKLFGEPEFQERLTRARWRSYVPAFAIVTEMVEGALRPAAGSSSPALTDALVDLSRSVFSRYEVPRGERSSFWEEAVELVQTRLHFVQGAPPRPVRQIPEPLARAIYDALPLNREMIADDYDYIFNNLRMNALRIHDDFLNLVEPGRLLPDLLQKHGPDGPLAQ
jgi:hypothetical protein